MKYTGKSAKIHLANIAMNKYKHKDKTKITFSVIS